MENGKEEYDKSLLDSLEKKYQLFLDSPNGEINVYLVLNKGEEDNKFDSMNKPLNNNINKNSTFQMNCSTNVLQPNRSLRNVNPNIQSDNEINNFS
jgi:hypothetical protein